MIAHGGRGSQGNVPGALTRPSSSCTNRMVPTSRTIASSLGRCRFARNLVNRMFVFAPRSATTGDGSEKEQVTMTPSDS